MSGYPTPKPALKIACAILAAAITDVPVVTKVPFPDRPAKFIRVDRVGGDHSLIVTDAARILVEIWTSSVEDAEDLSGQAIAGLQNAQGTIVDGSFIRGFDNIEGPVNLPDPDISDRERHQFQGDLLVSTS